MSLPFTFRRIQSRFPTSASRFYTTPPPPPPPSPSAIPPFKEGYRPKAQSPPPRPPPEYETPPPKLVTPIEARKTFIFPIVLLCGGLGVGYAAFTDAGSSIHPKVVMPLIRTLFDAEQSHRLAINFLKYAGPFASTDTRVDTENVEVEVSPSERGRNG